MRHATGLVFFSTWIAIHTAFGATTTPLDFNGWDASRLSSNGGTQLFTNVAGDLDVRVTAHGEFDAPSRYVSTQDGTSDAISTEHSPNSESNCHSYEFSFSEPTDLIVKTLSLDGQESYTVTAPGSMSYTNDSGIAPLVTSSESEFGDSNIHLDGIGFGRDPFVGSSDGSTFIDASSEGPFTVDVAYCANPAHLTKYGSFELFSVASGVTQQGVDQLPEPGSSSLLIIGSLMLLLRRRR